MKRKRKKHRNTANDFFDGAVYSVILGVLPVLMSVVIESSSRVPFSNFESGLFFLAWALFGGVAINSYNVSVEYECGTGAYWLNRSSVLGFALSLAFCAVTLFYTVNGLEQNVNRDFYVISSVIFAAVAVILCVVSCLYIKRVKK